MKRYIDYWNEYIATTKSASREEFVEFLKTKHELDGVRQHIVDLLCAQKGLYNWHIDDEELTEEAIKEIMDKSREELTEDVKNVDIETLKKKTYNREKIMMLIDVISDVIDRYKSGDNCYMICAHYNISPNTLKRIIEENEIEWHFSG